jgi:4-amino-4-deoxy-L-arabinose transferase-like glycosyltransferase
MKIDKTMNLPQGQPLLSRLNKPLMGLLLLAAGLRFYEIGQKQLWLDEIMSVLNASRPYGEMITFLKGFDAHPPVFQSLVWFWIKLGSSDGFVRIPSAIAGVGAVWMTYLIAGRLFGKLSAWLAATVMTFSAYHIYYSQELRLHPFIVLFVLGHLYILTRIIQQKDKTNWKWWVLYGFMGLLCLYTYVLCIYTIGAFALAYVAVTLKRNPQWLPLILTHILIGLLFLPWYPVLKERTDNLRADIARAKDGQPAPTPIELAEGVASWATAPTHWKPLRPTGAIVGLSLIGLTAIGLILRKDRRPAIILAIAFFVPILAYTLMPTPRVHAYDPKHLIFLQPLLIIGLSGITLPTKKLSSAQNPAIFVAILLLILNIPLIANYARPEVQKEQWADAYRDLSARIAPGEGILFNPTYAGFAFTYYAESEKERATIQALARETLAGFGLVKNHQSTFNPKRIWVISTTNPAARRNTAMDIFITRKKGFWPSMASAKQKSYPGELGTVTWRLWTTTPPSSSNP